MEWIHDNRNRFDKVIVCITDMGTNTNYSSFLKEKMDQDRITFIDMPRAETGQDWRNEAINKALEISKAEWVFFSEQDFFPLEGFWSEVEALGQYSNVMGYFQDNRLHPCCILMPRWIIEKTSKNFGVVKDISDHFGLFQKEIEDLSYNHPELEFPNDVRIGKLQNASHMNGLSQNL